MVRRILSITYVCKHCGQEYHPKSRERNTYCSRECAYAHKAAPPKESKKQQRTCYICGKTFMGTPNNKYCSDVCRKKAACLCSYESNKHKRACVYCGEMFIPEYKSGLSVYCCKEHKLLSIADRKRSQKKSTSAKMHKGGVSKAKRLRIFKRDGYCCQICGQPVIIDPVIGYGKPDDLTATIDHIVPISIAKQKGWTAEEMNSESNLQTAHFICNVMKGNAVNQGEGK